MTSLKLKFNITSVCLDPQLKVHVVVIGPIFVRYVYIDMGVVLYATCTLIIELNPIVKLVTLSCLLSKNLFIFFMPVVVTFLFSYILH